MSISYSEEGERLADTSACAGIRSDLKMCLLESDCCKIDRKTPRECLLSGSVSNECQVLRNIFLECKRSLKRDLIDIIFSLIIVQDFEAERDINIHYTTEDIQHVLGSHSLCFSVLS